MPPTADDIKYKDIEDESKKACSFHKGDRVKCIFDKFSSLILGDVYIIDDVNVDGAGFYNLNVHSEISGHKLNGCFWPRFELVNTPKVAIDYMQITRDIVGGR